MNRRKRALMLLMGDETPQQKYVSKVKRIIGSNLLRYYPLDDISGNVAIDKSSNAVNAVYVGSPTLGETGVVSGSKSVKFVADSLCNIYSASLNAGFNTQEATIGLFFKAPSEAYWSDDAQYFWGKVGTGTDYLQMYKSTANIIFGAYNAGSTLDRPTGYPITDVNWHSFIVTVSKSNDRLRTYTDGVQRTADATTLGVWSGALDENHCLIGAYDVPNHTYSALGWIAHFFIATRELTASEVANLSSPFDRIAINFWAIGDSKAANELNWRVPIIDTMLSVNQCWQERPSMYALGGYTMQIVKDGIDAELAARTDIPDYVVINLGINDIGLGDPGIGWKTNTAYIVDAIHTKYPSAKIYLTKVWGRDRDVGIAAINGYIDQLVSDANYSSWLFIGVNEADFIPAGDDGATYSIDGYHWTADGYALWGAAWKTRLGY